MVVSRFGCWWKYSDGLSECLISNKTSRDVGFDDKEAEEMGA